MFDCICELEKARVQIELSLVYQSSIEMRLGVFKLIIEVRLCCWLREDGQTSRSRCRTGASCRK